MATRKKVPVIDQDIKAIPDTTQQAKQIPDAVQDKRKIPSSKMSFKQKPAIGNPQNTVIIGDTLIEIKPTKLLYQRNRTATFYHVLQLYPLTDILSWEPGQLGDDRDGDKAVMDWLIAATDNEQLITKYYDEIDTGTVEKILEIFKRVNKYAEKEAKLKNLERTQKTE